ncbi:hypothetical protein EGR_07275 [Echinococcus granulosus]|uniref:Uncharacterized protein n=1 Tax=Echinococcus granulosus TaxID=6210 RepID=W6U937_ECHGR|nr:hypothetical protein EGR_07275 [Echinococcus granulosus]EUB57913.1 hypothetical protein EGR_07275 [Echinococcus granulosus]
MLTKIDDDRLQKRSNVTDNNPKHKTNSEEDLIRQLSILMLCISTKSALALTLVILLCLQTTTASPQNSSNADDEEMVVEYYNNTLGRNVMDGGGLRIEMASSAPQQLLRHLPTRCCFSNIFMILLLLRLHSF